MSKGHSATLTKREVGWTDGFKNLLFLKFVTVCVCIQCVAPHKFKTKCKSCQLNGNGKQDLFATGLKTLVKGRGKWVKWFN